LATFAGLAKISHSTGIVRFVWCDDVNALNNQHGKIPIPLWLDGPYVSFDDEPQLISYFLVDGAILQTDGWCGGRVNGLDEQFPDFFPNHKVHRPPEPSVRRHLWEIPEAPQIIKTNHMRKLTSTRHNSIATP
jgi:hypothetical protein